MITAVHVTESSRMRLACMSTIGKATTTYTVFHAESFSSLLATFEP
jgi:hypothetical protein